MPALRSSAVALLSVLACQALPSAIPLADTGGRLSFSRQRSGDFSGSDSESFAGAFGDEDMVAGADVETVEVSAGASEPGPDAGVDGGSVTASPETAKLAGWAGEYYGSDRFVRRLGEAGEDEQVDDKAHTRVEESGSDQIVVSIVSSSDGTVICSVKMSVSGSHADLVSGEGCQGLGFRPPIEASGTAELDGDELTVDFEGFGEFEIGDDAIDVELDYHFEGRRR